MHFAIFLTFHIVVGWIIGVISNSHDLQASQIANYKNTKKIAIKSNVFPFSRPLISSLPEIHTTTVYGLRLFVTYSFFNGIQ